MDDQANPRVKVVKLNPGAELPNYAGPGAAGADIRACLAENIVIPVLGRVLVPTGISIELPIGYEAQVRPRSGLALKYGVSVLNAPGTIDSDYRGELKVLLINLGSQSYTVAPGERIAQLIIAPVARSVFQEAEQLSPTERGAGGFGSTGI